MRKNLPQGFQQPNQNPPRHRLMVRFDAPPNYRAVRDDRWKLILSTGKDGIAAPVGLYDLGSDSSEKFDRLAQHPDIAERLLAETHRFRDSFNERGILRFPISRNERVRFKVIGNDIYRGSLPFGGDR